ncbi:MAG: SOS response-associated peptidase [Phycisphaerae bacterium]
MCGRYTITVSPRELGERFSAEMMIGDWAPRYNAAPTQDLPVVLNADRRTIELLRWGLIPSWAKDPAIGNRMINARSESLAEKPSFRAAFKRRRCLVVADGFYEWDSRPDGKVPMRIALADDAAFAFAGLWERWTDPKGGVIRSFTIVTTEANDRLRPIHERMPVILRPEAEALWLERDADPEDLREILRPYESDAVRAYAVSRRVNSPRNDDPALILAVEAPPARTDQEADAPAPPAQAPNEPDLFGGNI